MICMIVGLGKCTYKETRQKSARTHRGGSGTVHPGSTTALAAVLWVADATQETKNRTAGARGFFFSVVGLLSSNRATCSAEGRVSPSPTR
ncbi:hypothetical protein ACLOJK_001309, partial [Asimina triloba]